MNDNGTNVMVRDIGWRPIIRALVGVAGLLLAMYVARELADLLRTILVAIFLAIAADAAARFIQRAGLSRARALVAVILGGLVVGVLAVLLLVPPLVSQAADLVEAAPDIARDFEQSDVWQRASGDLGLGDDVVNAVKDVAVEIPRIAYEFVQGMIGGIFGLVTVLIAVGFLLAGGGQALGLLVRLAPPLATTNGWAVVVGAYNNIGRYIIGATGQAICAGVSLALVLWLLGVPYALALGVFMLIMDYIPLVGATIGSVPAVAVALFSGGLWDAVGVLVFLVVYQQVENTVIQPRIQGKVVNLPGIAIFFSVMVGGQLLGVLGALIAVPVASILAIMLRQYFEYVDRPPVELPKMFDERGRPLPAFAPTAGTATVDAPE